MTSKYNDVVEFYGLVGLESNDSIVIGKKHYRRSYNTIDDIPKFCGREDVYITPNPIKDYRLKQNVLRYNTGYSDLDFRDYEWAMCESGNIIAIMEDYGFYYGLVCSGRGLQLYVPVRISDLSMGSELNKVLNHSILRDYYLRKIVDRSLITNYATFLRLPGTINSKNGKLATIIHHNLDPSIDYFTHNYEILLQEYRTYINSPPKVLIKEVSTTKFDYEHGSFRSELLERMVALDQPIVRAVREIRQGRKLNSCLYPNLAVYIYGKSNRTEGAFDFVEQIQGNSSNLRRWLERYGNNIETGDKKGKITYNAKALLNWAQEYFGHDHLITRLAQHDFTRLKYHNGYFKFIEEQPSYDSVELLREEMRRFVQENRTVPGFHWIIGETGLGKSTLFDKLHDSGTKVVTLVPYLMLMYNMGRGSVYTYDSIAYKSSKRIPLMREMLESDVIVVDEAHCLKTFRPISEEKAQMLDLLEETLADIVEHEKKPVFLLTSTPSVEQIPAIHKPESSRFIGFLEKEQKKVCVHIIDKDGIQEAVRAHDKVLIFIDHKKEVKETERFLAAIGVEHKVFTVSSYEKPEEKHEIEREIKSLDKYVIIGTSSVSSGINIPLDSIIFTNRMMNQQTVYQVMGRLRIINKLGHVHPIYIVNQPVHRIPNWAKSMDLFEFVSPNVLMKYISKLYRIEDIKDRSRSKVISFNDVNKTAEIVRLIKSTPNIGAYYRLPEVQAKKLYLIPVGVIKELGASGWIDQAGWANMTFKEIKALSQNDTHQYGRKVKCRNTRYGYHNPVYHYYDPTELCGIMDGTVDGKRIQMGLPKEVRKVVLAILQNRKCGGDEFLDHTCQTAA